MRRFATILALTGLAAGVLAVPRHLVSQGAIGPDFVHFESAHVRPAALTPSGDRLLVVNTPDNRLSVFDLTGPAPVRIAEIPVGLEPISVAARDNGEAWVVNHVSDDVSIVDLTTMNVRRTLRVGDEPADVVFAGGRAYVSVSQEDRVRVYDPANLDAAPTAIPIPGRFPRSLARDAAGAHVYVAVFHGGNRTSVLGESEVPNDSLPVDPDFPRNPAITTPHPQTGLIVQQDGAGDWRDMYGKLWNYRVAYAMNEADVVEIVTAANFVSRTFGDLGTVNLALDVASADGRIALAATEARNLVRFEPRLRGHMVDTRLGLVTAAGTAATLDLNPHIDYDVVPGTPAERDSAIGIPTGVAFSGDGQRLYVTSLATDRLAVIDPAAGGPAAAIRARVPTVGGPTGVVVDDARGRLYVVGRFRNELQTFDVSDLSERARASIGHDPTPDPIVNGRRFFYGGFTSAHGDQACATCHVFGDLDNIGWDLGDPGGAYLPAPPGMIDPLLEGFDPEKGPMTTQTLRGLPGTGRLHWRGDRADLAAFNPAFVGLMGRATPLPDSEFTALSDFILALVHPPNPAQFLDRTMPDAPVGQPSAKRGQDFFMNVPVDAVLTCNNCHAVPTGTNGQVIDDAALQEDQDIKVPQLRNMYRKTGFSDLPGAVNKRGFGFIHDGSVDNLFNFLQFPGFNFGLNANAKRRDLEAFLLAFDTGMAPAVGFQLTFDGSNDADPTAIARMDTLEDRAFSGDCELIATGRVGGEPRGWLYQGGGQWQPDRQSEPPISSAALRGLGGAGGEITVTGVPLGSGERMGIDRDRDGHLDGDERDAGSDPGNPASTPANVAVGPGAAARTGLSGVRPNPFRAATEVAFTLARPGSVDLVVYDLFGREVRALALGVRFEAGAHTLRWDGRTHAGRVAAAGVYFVRLRTADGAWTRPVVRIR